MDEGTFRRVAIWSLGLILLVAVLVATNTLRSYAGLLTRDRTSAELSALLSPAYAVHLPDGAGPFPTALLFSGCDGPHDNLDRLAADLNAAGWAAIIVDSHGPRGLREVNLWRLVCTGQILGGPERAGDVAVALNDARAMAMVDADRLVLIGASHGGWAILDLLALLGAGELPYSLTDWPVPPGQVLSGVQAVVLFYPYCGIGSQVASLGWSADIPALFLLVQDDAVASETACQRIIDRMQAAGRPIETTVLQGVTHGFDQQDKAAFSALEFDAAATAQALALTRDFISRHVD